MNQNLQNIVEIIQQSEKLDAEQKKNLIKAVKDADKELEITAFKLERTEKVKKTTAILLEETIAELEQKRKDVEKHNRELEIEAALERVRAIAMGMKKPADMVDVCSVISDQLQQLGIENIRNVQTVVINEQKQTFNNYQYFAYYKKGIIEETEYDKHPRVHEVVLAMKKSAGTFYGGIMEGEELNNFREYRKQDNQFPDPLLDETSVAQYNFYSTGISGLGITSYKVLNDSAVEIFKRFHKVFTLAYSRFKDIEKAEAQARESEIQLALERVRARTMAMQHSSELSETASIFFKQLSGLGIEPNRLYIGLFNDDSGIMEAWATAEDGSTVSSEFYLDSKKNYSVKKMFDGWKEKKEFLIIDMKGKELSDYIRYISEESHVPVTTGYSQNRRVQNIAYFSKGLIGLVSPEPQPDENISLLERFAKVFDQTYTRFLDLQKAEAQAREAQIEAALERVRARSMAMHHTSEIQAVIYTVHKELLKLSLSIVGGSFVVINKDVDTELRAWGAGGTADTTSQVLIPNFGKPFVTNLIKGIQKGPGFFTEEFTRKEKIEYFTELFKHEPWSKLTNKQKKEVLESKGGYTRSCCVLNHISILIINQTGRKFSEEENDILKRFTRVFEQTYIRFLDLQKAEAQAREAQIEAGLEKVRARAMAMHNSEDLSAAVNVFFKELKTLGLVPRRCGVAIINETTHTAFNMLTTATSQGDSFEITGEANLDSHPLLTNVLNNWKQQKEYFPILKGDEIKEYYKVLKPQVAVTDFEDTSQYGFYMPFKEGVFYVWADKNLEEEQLRICRKFTSVIGLTYRRYLDLKDAEARAFEAIRQSSLDRVRAEIASMRNSEDLNRITPVIWRELKILEVPFIRCGVFIVSDDQTHTQVYLTTPEGKSLGVLNLSTESNALTRNSVDHWKKNQIYRDHWNKEEFINWTKSMMKLGQVQNPETYQGSSQPPESLHLHFVPFAQGMLYVGNVAPLDEEKLDLVKTLAKAFSIAYARYEDFKSLEEAKEKVEDTLKELKSAQAQLVHSEKMASLGELTAGIAHEIKNPLNFVNNFSEVSGELLDEMKEELKNKNEEEVAALIENLKQNLEKINHHGKRADSIVKGMLLHSRGTASEKTPTDINDLLEQYANLAYHGMRAQNKDFNITIERDYDKSLEKINVVPQDLSRVFLNIINNGCYAANDRKKTGEDDFSPVIKVSTKNLKDKVEIRIKDNGNGVPEKIKDKLFQPFFTTKPTGEGTGLGLSLSYDIIVKQHGGEIKIESKEGEGAEFIISLPNN